MIHSSIFYTGIWIALKLQIPRSSQITWNFRDNILEKVWQWDKGGYMIELKVSWITLFKIKTQMDYEFQK